MPDLFLPYYDLYSFSYMSYWVSIVERYLRLPIQHAFTELSLPIGTIQPKVNVACARL